MSHEIKRTVLPYAGPEEMAKSMGPEPIEGEDWAELVGVRPDEIERATKDRMSPVEPMTFVGKRGARHQHRDNEDLAERIMREL